jgi:type I restriction enzyme R subunit
MNGAETRAELIDPLLAEAGWAVVEGSRIQRKFSIPPGRIDSGGRRGKPLTADYMLTYRKTQLAVVDAKVYAGKLQLRFTYVSSGVQELA